ncbi:VOC family protein [Patulibacter sp. SYSU D01012]|uniref:VOC family protein n=1 Tax=Patulibacter sp. SYSU D01012 TaxID=2817381 RepID=UPI001B308B5E|nr:VOC family protein [Patulibacter sp. SYSU D01012]
MKLEGLHHVTMITGDAQRIVDFYADVLGLRLVKTTVNFDQPEAYHLYFGDEAGSPGSILTWFEFAGARPGRPGAGMVHRLVLAVPTAESLDFWAGRLATRGVDARRDGDGLRFADPDGLELELLPHDIGAALRAEHPDVPQEHAITGIQGARAYARDPHADDPVLTRLLGFDADGPGRFVARGEERHVHWTLDPAPAERGVPGAGTVHHIAWASRDEDHEGWRQRLAAAGAHVTPVIDRDYFDAIYFREPRGVLFEIATLGPGFATDEDAAHLGEELRLPTQHEPLRAQLGRLLTPLTHPRTHERIRA